MKVIFSFSQMKLYGTVEIISIVLAVVLFIVGAVFKIRSD